MNFSDEIVSLGKSLGANGAQYKANELFKGIKNEQIRLGKNPFVVIVSLNTFDMDGQTDFVFLMDSFANQDAAEVYANNLSNALLEYQLKQDNCGQRWTLQSKGSAPYISTPRGSEFLTVITNTFKVVSGDFDRKYVITRVFKTNGNNVVNQSLFDAVNSDFELWDYFVKVGESSDGKRERPSPFTDW